uniref:Astrotactin-1/2 N-terminal domain-containing protein n=1 Tax=Knipowitschia caucasica TaxID=637954 RepID=A0AAV2IWB8_KNICA
MSGTVEEISLVHWKQQWLENGTLFFHVTLTESELPPEATPPSAREPAHVHEHMHLLHISVMVSHGYDASFPHFTHQHWQREKSPLSQSPGHSKVCL